MLRITVLGRVTYVTWLSLTFNYSQVNVSNINNNSVRGNYTLLLVFHPVHDSHDKNKQGKTTVMTGKISGQQEIILKNHPPPQKKTHNKHCIFAFIN